MLEIKTIRDFQALPVTAQREILKALKTKDRLETWLAGLNKLPRPTTHAEWRRCKKCHPEHPGWYLDEYRDDNDIHPSAIHKCVKLNWYACSGFASQMVDNIEPKLRMIFDMGHAWHHTVQGYGKKGAWSSPEVYHPEVPIDPDAVTPEGNYVMPVANDLWIRGHVDALIDRYEIFGVPGLGDVAIRVVHEYKTINSNGFAQLRKPKPEHKWQATIYSACLDAPVCVYLYVNKDNCNLVDYPVAFDLPLWQDIVAKIRLIQRYVEGGSMPPWSETFAVTSPFECKKCPFQNICQPDRR